MTRFLCFRAGLVLNLPFMISLASQNQSSPIFFTRPSGVYTVATGDQFYLNCTAGGKYDTFTYLATLRHLLRFIRSSLSSHLAPLPCILPSFLPSFLLFFRPGLRSFFPSFLPTFLHSSFLFLTSFLSFLVFLLLNFMFVCCSLKAYTGYSLVQEQRTDNRFRRSLST